MLRRDGELDQQPAELEIIRQVAQRSEVCEGLMLLDDGAIVHELTFEEGTSSVEHVAQCAAV